MLINQIGYFNSVALAVACLIAVVSLKGNYKTIGLILAVNFFMMVGYDALINWDVKNIIFLAPLYSIKIMLQFAFLIIFVYLGAWSLAIASSVIIGILSYSIVSSLYGINPLYYIELMQSAVVAQLLLGVIGAFDGCRFTKQLYRCNTHLFGGGAIDNSSPRDKK